jgi:probable HAF family extracellular repeat protein
LSWVGGDRTLRVAAIAEEELWKSTSAAATRRREGIRLPTRNISKRFNRRCSMRALRQSVRFMAETAVIRGLFVVALAVIPSVASAFTFSLIQFPGATATVVQEAGGRTHGFLLADGMFTVIDVPGAANTEASGINDRGQIVGVFFDASGAAHGFVLENGLFTLIDADAGGPTLVSGINNRGQIVGTTGFPPRGFLFENGAFTVIAVPGASFTGAFGINRRAAVVGVTGITEPQGFLLDGGVFVLIDVAGAQETTPFGINSRGDIVGRVIIGGTAYGFLAT